MSVQPIRPEDVILPMSPYYGPLGGVTATRNGTQVTITWGQLVLRAGDDSEQFPYLVEVWHCQGGQFRFEAIGTYSLAVTIEDESGCQTASHARVYGVEKHGYTRWVEVPWP